MNNPTVTAESQPAPIMTMVNPDANAPTNTTTTTNNNNNNNNNDHQNNRTKYAPVSAPWRRPEAEMETSESDDDSENHTDPGAFRVVGNHSVSVRKDGEQMDLIHVAEQVVVDIKGMEDIQKHKENIQSSIVSVGSSEGDAGHWDTESATMGMLVQLKRRNSRKKILIPENNNLSSMMDSDQQQQEDILSTDCQWANREAEEQKEAATNTIIVGEIPPLVPELQRPLYAASTAPWTKPTGEREVSRGELEENHITPGAFRVAKIQDSTGAMRLCDRLSLSDDMELKEDEDDDVIVEAEENRALDGAFTSSDFEESKEVIEQLKRRKERKQHIET